MTSLLSENIQKLRKQQHLTQQNLADAMGVTVGAIHKWEQNLSTPDIRIIMDLACFFGTSVDSLVGYRMAPREKEQILKHLNDIRLCKTYAENWDLAESWLRQYPNDFEIVYQCGRLYHLAGIETNDPRHLLRAIALMEHAGNLCSSSATAMEIHQHMGLAYLDLDRKEEGLRQLKLYNPCGLHDDIIGMELSEDPAAQQEALKFLSQAMLHTILSLHHICSGYLSIFLANSDFWKAKQLLLFFLSFMQDMVEPGTSSFLTKDQAVFRALYAAIEWKLHNEAQAAEEMAKAFSLANTFDLNPDYSTASLPYCCCMDPTSTFDNSGSTAREAVYNALKDYEAIREEGLKLWEETCHGAE